MGTPTVAAPWVETAHRVNNIVNDPKSSAADIERVIAQDPLFAERIIKVAYACYKSIEVDTIKRAVVLLGTERVSNLAASQSLWRDPAEIAGHREKEIA